MSERNQQQLPTVGEVVAQLIASGAFDAAFKEHIWSVVLNLAPGYSRAAFERHWSQFEHHRTK
jgi:hypothetical protein